MALRDYDLAERFLVGAQQYSNIALEHNLANGTEEEKEQLRAVFRDFTDEFMR